MHAEGTTNEPLTNGQEKLKKMATSLKHQNVLLRDENLELSKIVQALRDGKYNQVEGAKLLMDEQIIDLRA